MTIGLPKSLSLILTNFTSAVVWGGFNSSSNLQFIKLLFHVLGDCSKSPIIIYITVIFTFRKFVAHCQGPGIRPDFCFLSLSMWDLMTYQNPLDDKFFSSKLKLDLIIQPRLSDPFISQSPRESYAFHFKDSFWFMNLSFAGMATFQFLSRFPIDQFLNRVVPILAFL